MGTKLRLGKGIEKPSLLKKEARFLEKMSTCLESTEQRTFKASRRVFERKWPITIEAQRQDTSDLDRQPLLLLPAALPVAED